MQITHSSKRTPSTSQSHTGTKSSSRTQNSEDSSAIKNTNENSSRGNAYVSGVINGQSLLNIRSMHSLKDREKKKRRLDDRIIINVCGDRYETHRTTLELYPDTLLGNSKRRKYYYDKTRNEYFFDRHRACFAAILYYYQSNGRLRRPDHVSIDIFLEEVTFFQLGREALNQIRKDENIKEVKKLHLPKNRIRRYIWATMEYPDYSLTAKIVNIISLLMVLISTILLAVETLPQYVHLDDLNCVQQTSTTTTTISYISNKTDPTSIQGIYTCYGYYKSPFFIIQIICVAFFTIELALRIITMPSLLDFIKNLMNWVDVLAVFPFYIALIIRLSGGQGGINSETYVSLRLLRVLRLVRVFKFFRVFKNVKSLRVLVATIKQSLLDFLIMIIILTLLGFLFGAAVYYAETASNGEEFDSILKATYWGIITITSVGYGDMTPITPGGRIIACLCALFGAATIGMLVSVLVDRYQRVYARKLFINEEQIDFHDYSDEENNDIDSRNSSVGSKHQTSPKIEDPDARAIENAMNENNTTEIPQTPDPQIETDENVITRNSSRIRFIIGYVDNENQETSHELIEKISSVVANRNSSGDHVSLNIIANENLLKDSPDDVQFQLESSDDDDNELTEISPGCRSKGNVLKSFQRRSSQTDNQLNNSELNI